MFNRHSAMHRLGRALVAITMASWVWTVADVAAQAGPPLPDSLHATFGTYEFADRIYPTAWTENEFVIGSLSFNTVEKYVDIDWDFKAPGGPTRNSIERITVSYQPTAVCRKAGVSPIFFVVGYIQRTDQVIVEEWGVTNMLLGTALGPGGVTESSFSKIIEKNVVALTGSLQPIVDAAYNRYANKLWLLEAESPHVLWECDPASGNITALADESIVPALATAKSMWTVKIGSGAQLSGFVIIFKKNYTWKEDDASDNSILLMRDADLDGTIEESVQLTWAEYAARGYWTSEITGYT